MIANSQLLLSRIGKFTIVLQSIELLRALFRHKVLASAEHRNVLKPLLVTIIDVGANRGQFALAVRHWAPKANIISFEPLTEPSSLFRKIFNGDSNVTLHRTAIGPEKGTATIHISASDDSSSLLPIAAMQEQLFPGTNEIKTEKIQVGRLSDFVSADQIVSPAMLKLDVQGFELKCLQGCEDLLDRFQQIYVECSFVELYKGQALADEVIAWLRDRNFILQGVYNTFYDSKGAAVQGDFLFANRG